jgi:hypothetical protein
LLARFQARPEKANEYARAGLFKECNDKLANDFAAQWPEDDFNRAFVHAVEMVFMDARDNPKLLKALQVGKKTARHVLEAGSQRGGAKGAGRPMTDQTLRIDRIMKAAKVNRRRAYEIDLDGTGIRWQRLALAAEFEKDPARCVPAFWELANGSRPGRMASGLTFRAYVESGADQFEDAELGDVLTLLAAMYERGEPPDHFRTLEDFTNYFAVRLGLNAGHVFTLWGRYQKAKAN